MVNKLLMNFRFSLLQRHSSASPQYRARQLGGFRLDAFRRPGQNAPARALRTPPMRFAPRGLLSVTLLRAWRTCAKVGAAPMVLQAVNSGRAVGWRKAGAAAAVSTIF